MKITDELRFPYPVLSAETGDYLDGEFALHITILEKPKTGEIRLRYAVELSEKNLKKALDDGKAELGLFVTCGDTFYNSFLKLNPQETEIVLPANVLRGRVLFRAILWARTAVDNVPSSAVHEEFSLSTWGLSERSIVAIGEASVFFAGREKLAPLESIFTLAKDNDVPEGEIRVRMDQPQIVILSEESTFKTINQLRGGKFGRTLLLNSLYLPAIMEILSTFGDDAGEFDGLRWHKVFVAKCTHLGLGMDGDDILQDTQKILKSPFNRLAKSRELGDM